MSRAVPAVHTSEAYKQQTDEAWIDLIEFTHAQLAVPLRVAANHEQVIHDGATYSPYPVRVVMPGGGSGGGASLEISNIDQQVIKLLRSIESAISVTVKTVLASDTDAAPVQEFIGLEWRQVHYDANIISGHLVVQMWDDENLTGAFTASRYPGLF